MIHPQDGSKPEQDKRGSKIRRTTHIALKRDHDVVETAGWVDAGAEFAATETGPQWMMRRETERGKTRQGGSGRTSVGAQEEDILAGNI
ncbi:hypothetical protein EMCG_08511 [[Emmonsia] crescens]|uniref:Uncharacterized protein n=1 Tax=[Emmonsia] crescens TaxID=73230 RepID=A0A0G2I5Y2_9EURO|nr:hypothetical protein EMCG_08511 [Emmonsia crescens UAMH 3008]